MDKWKPSLTNNNLKQARQVLFHVVDLLNHSDINYHLEGGTLLGIVRDGDLLPWDYDVDISIPKFEAERFLKLKWKLLLKGYKISIRKSKETFGPITVGQYSIFKIKPIIPYLIDLFYPKNKENFVVLDVFVKVADDTHTYWQAKERVMRVENRFYQTFEEVDFHSRKIKVPNHYHDYLTEKYGDWSIVIKEWCCRNDEKTICGTIQR